MCDSSPDKDEVIQKAREILLLAEATRDALNLTSDAEAERLLVESVHACKAFVLMGSRARAGVLWLISVLDDKDNFTPSERRAATKALGMIGTIGFNFDIIPALICALSNQQPLVRAAAAKAIRGIGGAEVLPSIGPLKRLLSDADWKVRFHAAVSLAELDSEGTEALSELVSTLDAHHNDYYRQRAARALAAMRGRAHSAVPSILKAAAVDKCAAVRRAAKKAHAEITGRFIGDTEFDV
jgi:HEAT repeat protein